ncbi:hypothetical protein D1F64_20265 [Breoghania sp. L-A4]|nr:hypothetical protein D1F64_20265 [Breoghania sp. L-A4]
MARSPDPLDQEATRIGRRLDRFEAHGDLAQLPTAALLDQVLATRKTLNEANQLCVRHDQAMPSAIWFFVSVGSGFGSLFFMEPTLASVAITAGGVAGAFKSLYDRGRHLLIEQRYLGLYWRANAHREALAVEMHRRGIRY